MTRKELVHKLADHLGVTPVYLAAPSFAYQVGDYTVDRQGNILDTRGQVVELDALLADAKEEPILEVNQDIEPTALEVELPLEGYEGQSLRNLLHIIYSKQPLIKKALNLDADLVSEEVITALDQRPMVTLDHFQKALEGKNCPSIDFNFDKETITFKLGQGGDDPEKVEAATQLLGLVNLNARRSKQNISAKVKATDNEKYTFRTWLLRLGMIGDDYRIARKVLLKNLSGNSAFRKSVKEEKTSA